MSSLAGEMVADFLSPVIPLLPPSICPNSSLAFAPKKEKEKNNRTNTYDLMNSSRSALTCCLCVVHMPWGAPL